MHHRILPVALLLAACVAAAPSHAADVVYPPGSKIGLVPPKGFEVSATGRGFEDRQNRSAILILEMPLQAYAEFEKAMTVDSLKKQGLAVGFRENVTLKNGKGVLIAGRQTVEKVALRKWILLGTTPDAGALVTALVPDDAKGAYSDAVMRAALATLETRASVPVDELLGLLPYKLNDLAGLRPFRVEAATVFMTEGPKDTTEVSEQPLMVVSAAPGGPAETPQRENFARNLFTGLAAYTDVRVLGTDVIRLGGVQTHQLLAEAKDAKTKTDVKLVQWVRFGNGAFIRFLGIARADAWPDAFTRFRAVRDGLGSP